jgi:type III restriction enzyme
MLLDGQVAARKISLAFFRLVMAETKGSMSSMELRGIEKAKTDCARKFFQKIASPDVTYDIVDGYGKLMELVSAK